MQTTRRHTDVAVLGGGFAGVYATKAITKALDKMDRKDSVTIISDDNHIVFQPMLPEVAASALSPRHVVNPIRHLCREASVFKGDVVALDAENKTLTLDAGSFIGSMEVSFDQLVVCMGSKTNVSMIPGMQEHAFLIQNVGDAMLIRATMISRFEEANLAENEEQKRRLLSFVFVGGGYSGVETAGQTLDMGKAMCRFYRGIDFSDCTFTLVHSGDVLLPTAHPKLGEYTKRKLEGRGLKVRLGVRVSAVTASRVYLNDDSSIEANTVVCAVGNAPNPFLETLEKQANAPLEKGRLQVQPDGSVKDIPWLWGAGDCCAFPHPEEGYCPPTAQFATRQGKLVGANVAKRLAGKETSDFDFKGLGELAAIGHHTAVADIKGLQFSGFLAWWLWRTIYLSKLPGLDRKIRVMFDWTLELFFPRDITLLNPRYSTDVKDTYLADGDTLFNKGDPAFSFYIIKSGTVEFRDDEKLVKTVRKGQHFGERALLGNGYFQFDAVATEPTTLVSVNRALFERVFRSDEIFAENLRRSAASFISEDELKILVERLPQEMLEEKVEAVMTTDVITFSLDQNARSAMTTLRKRSRNYIPIIDDERRVKSVIRKESLYLRLQASDANMEETVEAIPGEQLPYVRRGDSVKTAVTAMARNGYTKALVVDEDRRLEGVIALIDVFTQSKSAEPV